MSTTGLKNFILHVTSANPESLRDKLNENSVFRARYDGFEVTLSGLQLQSTRYYWYDVDHAQLTAMVRHLQANREGHTFRVKITPAGVGNHKFD